MSEYREYWKFIFYIVIPSVILFIVCGAIYTVVMRPAEVVNKLTNPDRLIYNYEYYFETSHDIQALKTQIDVAQLNVDSFVPTGNTIRDTTEQNRLNMVLQGLKFQLISVIEQYNASVDMQTRNFVKADSLPVQYQYNPSENTLEVFYE